MSADGKQKTVAYFDVASGDMGTVGLIHHGGHRGPAGLALGEPVRMHVTFCLTNRCWSSPSTDMQQ
jgi:hypothetical protein